VPLSNWQHLLASPLLVLRDVGQKGLWFTFHRYTATIADEVPVVVVKKDLLQKSTQFSTFDM